MAAKLASDGLDLPAIAANGAYFTNVARDATQPPVPLNYLHFPGRPMPSGSVRLSVLYNENPEDNAPFYQATLAIAAKLPPRMCVAQQIVVVVTQILVPRFVVLPTTCCTPHQIAKSTSTNPITTTSPST